MATRVLVVEDDPDIAELVARYLDKAGYVTKRVSSGRDALDAVRTKPPDLIVLDRMLPHVDGLEVCRLLRANEHTAAIPIIMLTARAEESERIVGLEMGADDYVAKPFSPNELVARVRALLRRAQRSDPPSGRPLTLGAIVVDPDAHTVSLDRPRSDAHGQGISAAGVSACSIAAACCRGTSCSSRSGAIATPAARARSTSTCAACAKSCRSLTEALVTVKQFGYKLVDTP